MISFFGASVTQQRNGYVDYFSKLQKEKVSKFGYGGMHLNNAGICFIDEVVKRKPNICFLDWYSTSYHNQDGNAIEYLNAIIFKLQNINCRVISLFLPNNNNDDWQNFYDYMKQYHISSGIEFIEIDKAVNHIDINSILRDSIHTNTLGAKLYGDIINKYLDNHIQYKLPVMQKNKYVNINRIDIKQVYNNTVNFEGNCQVVGIYNKIGRYSGYIELNSDGTKRKILIWDRWCHYIRNHFNFCFTVTNQACLKILQSKIDFDDTKIDIDYGKNKKKFVIISIYFIGDSLRITNKNEGSSLKYYSIMLHELYYKAIHSIKMLIKRIIGVN